MQSFTHLKLFQVDIMKLLCVFVLLFVISSNVTATFETEFYGTWTMVKAFRDANVTISDDDDFQCTKFKFGPSESKCTCNGVDLVTFVISQVGRAKTRINIPGFIADTHDEAFDFAGRSCKIACGGEFKVFRKFNDNYFVMYFSTRSNLVPDAALLAKSVPSLNDLDAFVNNLNELKDKVKVTLCTSDSNN